jgi:hypothetical protein
MHVSSYIWRATKDGRTRKSHRLMDGVIVFWEDPPAPESFLAIRSTLGHYNAGDCPNCRCYPQPVLRLDRIDWPHKVYSNGIIRPATQSRFAGLSQMQIRRAA